MKETEQTFHYWIDSLKRPDIDVDGVMKVIRAFRHLEGWDND